MKVIIKGEPKEIAALVRETQERQGSGQSDNAIRLDGHHFAQVALGAIGDMLEDKEG